MMKKILAAILCVGAALTVTACGGSSEESVNTTEAQTTAAADLGFEYNIENYEFYEIDDFSQYVKLGQYEGVAVTVSASDEEVDSKIQEILKTYAEKEEVSDGTVEDGDTVNIDYTGYIDGEAFEGGSDTDYDLVIGSNAFIDGFESGLIGAKTGDKLDLDVTFPDNYRNPDYAGKDAVFKVTVNKITRAVLPELNDEFANKYNSEYQTVEDFKAGVKAQIESDNKQEDVLTNKAWNAVVSNCEIIDIPEEMIKYYYDSLYASYAYYVYYNYNYSSIEDYIEACDDLTLEELKDTFMTQAQGYAGSELVYRAICDDKGYEITDEVYNEYKENYKAENDSEPTDIEVRQGLLWEYARKCVMDSIVCE